MQNEQNEQNSGSENALNSVTALAKILNAEPKLVLEAEKNNKLHELLAEFNNKNQVFSAQELALRLTKERENYLRELITSQQKPKELYDNIAAAVLEKREKQLKSIYSIDTEYKDFDELLDLVVQKKSKQPIQNNPKDIERIKELEKQVADFYSVVNQNNTLKNTVLEYEKSLESKVKEVESSYQNLIIKDKLSQKINNIPFDDNGDKAFGEYMRNGFKNEVENLAGFQFDKEKNRINIFDKQTNQLIPNKLGEPIEFNEFIDNLVLQKGLKLKQLKQGAGVQSTKDNELKTIEQVRNEIANKDLSLKQQLELLKNTKEAKS